ncbi:MAG: ParB/RepB/Spo0J family partition protein [Clostridiales bacterium]|nr:ParB/RepB/Spo0J family partition protein [Clostridiales bacterium]
MTQTNDGPIAVVELRCSHIVPGDNDRTVFEAEALAELAGSIDKEGLIQPITVRPIVQCENCGYRQPMIAGSREHASCPGCREACSAWQELYEIVAGERRFRAVSEVLGWTFISAIVREMSDDQADGVMLAENLKRADLNPIDEARAYAKRMERHGWDAGEVARHANVTARRVQNRLDLLRLVPEAQDLVAKGHLSLNFATVMAPLLPAFQRKALEYFATTERPLLREFQAIVGKLMVEQAQTSLFDLGNFQLAVVVAEHTDDEAQRKSRRFPTSDKLPLIRKVGGIGLSLETYIAELLESDDPEARTAAPIVGRLYEGMLASGLCFVPRQASPLDKYQ